MIYGGIDPGLDGALCFIESETHRVVAMIPMPVLKLSKGKGTQRAISPHALLQELRDIKARFHVERVAMELASPRPGEGTVSSFKSGRSYGLVEMAIITMDWPISYVTAQKWKRDLGFPAGAEKDESINRANRMMPLDIAHWTIKRLEINKMQSYGRAESALIGLHATGARLF